MTREAETKAIGARNLIHFPCLKKCGHEENLRVDYRKSYGMLNQLVPGGTGRPAVRSAGSFKKYLRNVSELWWFYSSMIIAILELVLVIGDAQVGVALFFRMTFGLGILGIIPGFLTTLVLFPKGQLSVLERVTLSIFLSVLISISVGVVLGLGPYFQPANNIIVLATYVVLMDIIATYRGYQLLGNRN